jgi:Beta-propeller repeat
MKKKRDAHFAFLNFRILLGLVMSFGAVLFTLFAMAGSQVLARERAGVPNQLSLVPSGSVQEAWVVRYDGPVQSADSAVALAIDGSGDVYVTGGSTISGFPPDYVTTRYDSAGQQQWLASFNGGDNTAEFANAIALDSSGNVYVTGIGWGYGND